MESSISFLIGAGFSAPMGYPVGNTLNNLLLNCTGENFAFHSSGTLVVTADGKKPDFGLKTQYDLRFEFCRDLINYFYQQKEYFGYEEFYDFIKEEAKKDNKVDSIAQKYLHKGETVEQLISSLDNIYSQLVGYYLIDKNGEAFYDNAAHACEPYFTGYTGILNCFKKLAESYMIHVHTLNHDLFFERFNYSDWLNGELCDGFEELGSPYYGQLQVKGRYYKVRLERYTGKYDKIFRLYKLHGSRDYGVYYRWKNGLGMPDKYIKIRYGIGFGDLYRENRMAAGTYQYEHCWINYHADFLTGTTSKIERYKEPLLYKTLFKLFRKNLQDASKLIIIGYGGKDQKVNEMLVENFDFKNKRSFIIDPFAGEQVLNLASRLNSKIIGKHLEDVSFEDLEIKK